MEHSKVDDCSSQLMIHEREDDLGVGTWYSVWSSLYRRFVCCLPIGSDDGNHARRKPYIRMPGVPR